jgi:hypothetical protein
LDAKPSIRPIVLPSKFLAVSSSYGDILDVSLVLIAEDVLGILGVMAGEDGFELNLGGSDFFGVRGGRLEGGGIIVFSSKEEDS